ncbi:hypothetical protein [Desulfogranum japonicum]|uniref:hypothetical protein n=1 Tax=Desulfogranum japonicum TaxID=231447 RepID=UPI0003FCA63D|nr:hypothetical protein [Desulfogranum japonicum]
MKVVRDTPSVEGTLFSITGRVALPFAVTADILLKQEYLKTGDVPMVCGDGEPKGHTLRGGGVRLADIITEADVHITEHNDSKKMYVVVSSRDGYATVFSWQEIFNTANGEGVLILTDSNYESMKMEEGRVDLISLGDYLSGPRRVRDVAQVDIRMV